MAIRFIDEPITITPKRKVRFLDEKPIEQKKPSILETGWRGVKESVSPAGLKERAKIVAQIGIGAIDSALAGIPKYAAKKIGMEIPEPQGIAEKIGRGAGQIAGFAYGGPVRLGGLLTRGVSRVIPKLAGKTIIPTAARLGIESAGAVATSDIPRAIEQPGEVSKESLLAGTMGLGLPIAGKGIQQLAKGTERFIGGVTKGTQDWITKRGAKTVFTPEKAQIDYIGKEIVPKLQERLAMAIEKNVPGIDNTLVKLGIPREETIIIQGIAPEKRKFVSDIIRGKTSNVQKAITNQKQIASKLYGTIIKNVPENTTINVKDTYFRLKRGLQDMGILDLAGNFKKDINIPQLGRVPEAIIPTPQSKLSRIYSELSDYVKHNNGKLSLSDYQRIVNDELESALSNNPRWDRIVYSTQNSLRKNATVAIPQLKQVNKIYADASNLEQISKSLEKLSEEGKQPLNVVLENKILSLRDPKKYQLREDWKNILGQDLYNKTLDHLANIDYGLVSELPGVAGGIYPSRAGLLRAGITSIGKTIRKMPGIPSSPLIPTTTRLGVELPNIMPE